MGASPGLNQYFQGEVGGSSSVTLALAETPQHTHTATAAQVPRPVATAPVANSFNESSSGNLYSTATSPLVAMSSAAVSVFGGSGPHNNLMPYLGMYWIISMQGVFPPRS
jgi:microcystin-dependent protein